MTSAAPVIHLIVAMAEDNVIGNAGGMPWHLPADLKRFRAITMGHPIIMGRKTWDSIGRPLPGRRNIVVTRNPAFAAMGAERVSSLEGALALCAGVADVFVIGGAELYRMALPRASILHLTRIHAQVPGDTFFPAIAPDEWHEIARESHVADEKNPHPHDFITLQRTPR